MPARIQIDRARVAEFCARWQVIEIGLFGSVLRDDFGPESDVDVLVTFAPEARWTLFDMVHMEEELESIFGRRVDLLTRPGVEASPNYIRRRSILSGVEVLHAA